MRVVGTFVAFNAGIYDVEQYWLKWLRVLGCVR